ncbi:MAG: hypothetical protein AUJ92_18875 [Armatimonadetes bacterium CG2_30_59_28]|nr:MAG: hypothetical protein AUJ92_18875 [Armatimonadetes bacterium CG2_30_59_28]
MRWKCGNDDWRCPVSVASFFGSLIPLSLRHQPHLLYPTLQGVQICSVNPDGPFAKTAVPKGIQKFKLTFPVLLDTKSEVADAYRVQTIPYLVLIGTKGTVRLNHLNYDPELQKIYSLRVKTPPHPDPLPRSGEGANPKGSRVRGCFHP